MKTIKLLRTERAKRRKRTEARIKLKKFNNLRLNILEILGRGAFGEVAVVFDDWERKYYALKTIMIDSSEAEAKDALESAFEEVQVLEAATRLEHPNISSLVAHDSLVDNQKSSSRLRILTELGICSLRDYWLIRKQVNEPWSNEEIMHVLISVCDGLQALSDAKIFHRDIKPDNIVITEEGQVKIVDFGVAEFLDAEGESFCNVECGSGTIPYIAPEISREDGEIVKTSPLACDLYALGLQSSNLSKMRWVPRSKVK